MAVPSCTYTLAAANTYATPEKAIEGIEKETIEAAKNLSPLTRQTVERSAKGYAEAARLTITSLATGLMLKISRFPDATEQETSQAIRQTWTTADNMRQFCLDALEKGVCADTLQKVDRAKQNIEGSSFDQLAAVICMMPVAPVVLPKPLSQSVQKLQELSKLSGRSRLPSF
jgi:hypothetical protein